MTTTVSTIFTYSNTRGHQFTTPTNYGSSTKYLDETWSLVKSSPPPTSGETSSLWQIAGEIATDITPFLGSGKDLFRGIRDGNLWQTARGIGGLALDIATLGTGSLIKGGIITTFKYGGVLIGWGGRKALGYAAKGGVNSAAHLSTNGVKLGEHLTQLEKYGAGGFKELANGRFRYYGEATLNRRNANSFRMVREWNPATGGKRTWFETLNPNGGVIQVRPEFGTGVKTHYLFNGTGGYLGKW